MALESTSVRVNFARPFPLFPLQSVTLLPHAMLKLFVFEPRYRQMVESVLDGRGQIAMAVFDGDRWKQEYHGRPPLRDAVCLGQIEHHRHLPDGNYEILLHGICRARIRQEEAPDSDRLYRSAMLEPLEPSPPGEEALPDVTERLVELISGDPLTELASCRELASRIEGHDVPANVLMELITLSVLNDNEVQYRLLAEGDAERRADMVEHELMHIGEVLETARRQFDPQAPKGCTWN